MCCCRDWVVISESFFLLLPADLLISHSSSPSAFLLRNFGKCSVLLVSFLQGNWKISMAYFWWVLVSVEEYLGLNCNVICWGFTSSRGNGWKESYELCLVGNNVNVIVCMCIALCASGRRARRGFELMSLLPSASFWLISKASFIEDWRGGAILFTLEDSNLSDMSQPAATVPATSVPGSPSSVPQPSAASTPSPILGEAVIPLVNKLQDIFSQLGSASTIDLPQVRILVPSMFTNNCIRICRT
jgi:hypothetical protein